jgi:hypothetical protein
MELKTSFDSKEIHKINIIRELMPIMKTDDINSISPIIIYKKEASQLKIFSVGSQEHYPQSHGAPSLLHFF